MKKFIKNYRIKKITLNSDTVYFIVQYKRSFLSVLISILLSPLILSLVIPFISDSFSELKGNLLYFFSFWRDENNNLGDSIELSTIEEATDYLKSLAIADFRKQKLEEAEKIKKYKNEIKKIDYVYI